MSKIADTVRALLAKAASTEFEHEAEVFLAKAHELMEKHQLSSADLEKDDPLGAENAYEVKNPYGTDWDFGILFPLARYFGCKAIRIDTVALYKDGKYKPSFKMEIVGRESARITVIEMHKYLVATIKKLGLEKSKLNLREFRKFRKNHWDEMVWTGEYLNADQIRRRIGNAMIERLAILAYREEKKNEQQTTTAAGKNALVTLNGVNALFKQRHPEAADIKGAGIMTSNAAREIANSIGLNRQTGGGSTVELLK
jgi:hypothetical protein